MESLRRSRCHSGETGGGQPPLSVCVPSHDDGAMRIIEHSGRRSRSSPICAAIWPSVVHMAEAADPGAPDHGLCVNVPARRISSRWPQRRIASRNRLRSPQPPVLADDSEGVDPTRLRLVVAPSNHLIGHVVKSNLVELCQVGRPPTLAFSHQEMSPELLRAIEAFVLMSKVSERSPWRGCPDRC